MTTYKIHIGADGSIKGFGPNVDEYQPYLAAGDTLEYSDTLPGPTVENMFTALRAERDARLTATDKYLLPDYPTSADNLALIKAYRAALRDLPDQTGAPWDGGGELTPWPELPSAR